MLDGGRGQAIQDEPRMFAFGGTRRDIRNELVVKQSHSH